MTTNDSTAEKRIVQELNFSARTAKRASWEAFEFSVEGPYLVRVTNASYGFEKEDHSYLVGIEPRNSLLVPSECDCKADLYNESDCKHKLALVAGGGALVLNAAAEAETDTTPFRVLNADSVTTGADMLQTDGGASVNGDNPETCANGDPRCNGPDSDELPCFGCFEVSDQ